MGIDLLALSKAKKYTNLVAIGLTNVTVDDVNHSISFTLVSDGSVHTIHFDEPSDGVSVTGVSVDASNILTVTLSDGSTINAGTINVTNGVDGDNGVSVTNVNINESNHLITTLSNGNTIDAGELPGSGGQSNVQSDWNQSNTSADDYIKNKPTIPSAYSLPTASNSVLGGVKVDGTTITINNGVISSSGGGSNVNPISKTAEMTQTVGVDTDGKLYTTAATQAQIDSGVASYLGEHPVSATVGDGTITQSKLASDLTPFITPYQKVKWAVYSGEKEVIENQGFKDSSTTIQSVSNVTSWKIAVTEGQEYRLTARTGKYSGAVCGVTFTNASGTKVSNLFPTTDTTNWTTVGSTLYMVNKEFTVPSGVVYMVVSSHTAYTAFSLELKSNENTLSAELAKTDSNYNVLTKETPTTVEELEDLGEFSPYYTTGYTITDLVARPGGRSKKYSCLPGDKFLYTGRANHTYGYAFFFTSSGALISTSTIQTGQIEDYTDVEVTIPSDCYYVVFFSFADSIRPLGVKKIVKSAIEMSDYDTSIETLTTNITELQAQDELFKRDIFNKLEKSRNLKDALGYSYKTKSKGYLYICVDDTLLDIDLSASVICGEYNYPLCFAASPIRAESDVIGISTYNETATTPKESVGAKVKDVWKYVVAHNGELLNHHGTPCFDKISVSSIATRNDNAGHTPAQTLAKYNQLSGKSLTMEEMIDEIYEDFKTNDELTCLDDFDKAYDMFVKKKGEIEAYGFNVRGCIQPGGNTPISVFIDNGANDYGRDLKCGGTDTSDKWVKTYYDYSDYWGKPRTAGQPNPYREVRGMGLGGYWVDGVFQETQLRADLEDLYTNKGYKGVYWHNIIWNDAPIASIRQFFNVVQEFVALGKIEVTTPSKYHDDFLQTKVDEFEARITALENA